MLELIATTIRGLAADAVEKAKSGHPGMPLGCAEIGAVLYDRILKHDPLAPDWPNRDRFVLSAGHGSMFLYSLLHLTGYNLPLEQLKQFRQLGSMTPGHPEYGAAPGIETTTGPLGQGIGNAVGMAIAERMLAARFNRPEHEIVDQFTYCIAGDGDMMEGVAGEAASLAGHLGLGRLIVLYDDNEISIEGETDLAFTESVGERFKAYGWHVQEIDGHDLRAIEAALRLAQLEKERPSLIVAKTRIARFAPAKEGSAEAHGAPLGEAEVAALKKAIGLPDEPFYVPQAVREHFTRRRQDWERTRRAWDARFDAWAKAFPDLYQEWQASHQLELPADLRDGLPSFPPGGKVATRNASGKVLQKLAEKLPYLVGGSADLAPSTKTYIDGSPSVRRGDFAGRNFHFGVREHGMGAIVNGISLHKGFRVYDSTFLVFADYMRGAIRLSALMRQPVIHIFTHDSIYVGEDGPTHQPIEQLESLRLIPRLWVFRPADGEETREAWLAGLERQDGPMALILTRQDLPNFDRSHGEGAEELRRGGYILYQTPGKESPDLVLVATGSEVSLSLEAGKRLESEGMAVRVVSMPCRELFLEQDQRSQERVLGTAPRLIVEAGVPTGWYTIARQGDRVIGMTTFGESGPAKAVGEHFGFTPERLVAEARGIVAGVGR